MRSYLQQRLPWVVLALTSLVCLYGFVHGRLWEQRMWPETGTARFLGYTAVYWAAAGLLVWLAPRWLGAAAFLFGILYSAWWAGVAAPLAVVYFLGSCRALGVWIARGADAVHTILVGAAVWMAVLWTALHFPVNTPWVYGIAFALPYVGLFWSRPAIWSRPATLWARAMDRREAAACAVLLYILIAHGLAALKPEISADGLSMHLALPMEVAQTGEWPFDFQHASWAVMPLGADSLYAGVFMLGGEAASQLLNVSFLAMTCLLIARAAREWVSPALGWLLAALFASTPLVQLVTGSLFVENVWAALVLASALAMRREDVRTGALLAGAAAMVKLIAVAFAIPLLAWGAWVLWRKRVWREAAIAAALFIALAAPVYAYAWAKSGNPIFPFANAIFKSPHYPSDRSFTDERFVNLPLTPRTPYDLTFHSSTYIEGQAGASGFQYLLLFPVALLFAWKRERIGMALVAVAGGAIVMLGAPNLRYLYAAMPLASLALAWPGRRAIPLCLAALIPLNLWFLPASGWYNSDFALFRHSDIAPYVERLAPARVLIDHLNREAPGQPVAFFSTDVTAGLLGKAYNDTWHSEQFWGAVRGAPGHSIIAAQLRDLGIEYVVAPTARESRFEVVQLFLQEWLDPAGPSVGPLALYRLRTEEIPPPRDTRPLSQGTFDDLDPRIEYNGSWLHDPQWAEAVEHSLTYSERPGNSIRLTFAGSALTYVYTKAANRGFALVYIDGELQSRVSLRSPQTLWRQSTRFDDFAPGEHRLEIRVAGGGFVDLDALEIE